MAKVFAVLHLLTAALVGIGVFVGLPQRWWPVDAGAALVVLGSMVASYTVASASLDRATTMTCVMHLVMASALLAALISGGAFLMGVYGPLGQGGMVVFALVVALVIPYLVAVPALELAWLRKRSR